MTKLKWHLGFMGVLCCTVYLLPATVAGQTPSGSAQPNHVVAAPRPELPPDGAAWRAIVGEKFVERTKFTIDVELDPALSVSNTHVNNTIDSTSNGGQGSGINAPMVDPGDTGFLLDGLWLFLHRDLKTNLASVITPYPGPMPTKPDFGFAVTTSYGRGCQGARMSGWDTHWFMNEPAASHPTSAAANRFNYFCTPETYLSGYLPIWQGVSFRAGRWGQGLGLEIPPNQSFTPNFFYSHSYTWEANTRQVFGFIISANVLRSPKNGYLMAEFGLNNGELTLKSPAKEPMQSFEGALRWRSPNMATWVDFNIRGGNSNIKDSKGDYEQGTYLLSPRDQMRIHYQFNVIQQFNKHWSGAIEGNYMTQAGDGKPGTVWMLSPDSKPFGGDHAISLNGKAVYAFNKKISLGTRLETFHDVNGYFLAPGDHWTDVHGGHVAKGNFNDFSIGANFSPIRNMRIRPEYRYDWTSSPVFDHQDSAVVSGAHLPKKYLDSFNMDMLVWF